MTPRAAVLAGVSSLPNRDPDGEFPQFSTWINKATSWIGGTNALCADAKGRICRNGGDFMRARDEGAFPVRYWHGEGPLQTARQTAKAQRQYHRAMRLQYPWRYA